MINIQNLYKIISNVLREMTSWSNFEIEFNSLASKRLLLATSGVESNFGYYFFQKNEGPGQGIFQIEPKTEDWIIHDFCSKLFRKNEIYKIFIENFKKKLPPRTKLKPCIYCLDYQIILARLKYWSIPKTLPVADDKHGLADYWKTYYNSELGAGKRSEFVRLWDKHKIGEFGNENK